MSATRRFPLPVLLSACLLAVVGIVAACSDSAGVLSPGASPKEPATPVRAPAPPFPDLVGPAIIYDGDPSIYDFAGSRDYHGGIVATRYVLRPDSTFALQFSSPRSGFFEYPGRYTQADNIITFMFDGWSLWSGTVVPWRAGAILVADTLHVSYDLVMLANDFADGAYVKSKVIH